jgi:hypothetical protein
MGKLASLSLKKKGGCDIYKHKPFKVKFRTSRQTINDLFITNSPEDIICSPIPELTQSHSLEKQVSTSVLK